MVIIKKIYKLFSDFFLYLHTIFWCVCNRVHYEKGLRVQMGVKKTFYITLHVSPHVKIGKDTLLWGNGIISIGENTSVGPCSRIYANKNGGVEIGKNVNIASHLYIIDSDHDIDSEYFVDSPLVSSRVVIEDNIWLAYHVTILRGSRVGTGSAIGACSVVTKNIPNYSVAVGVPAKVIKKRNFSEKSEKAEK